MLPSKYPNFAFQHAPAEKKNYCKQCPPSQSSSSVAESFAINNANPIKIDSMLNTAAAITLMITPFIKSELRIARADPAVTTDPVTNTAPTPSLTWFASDLLSQLHR
jgi:ABC-type uncharacterized transport system YnjBCD substrate-binding protein